MNANLNQLDVFPWNKNFETGIKKIDMQHRVLVSLLNKLGNCLVNTDLSEINTAFDELAAYAAMHFDDEEIIWSEFFTGDSWYSSHKITHDSFLPEITKIKELYSDATQLEMTEQIVRFLIRWLAFHIIDNDKRMAMALEAAKAGASLDEAKTIADNKMEGSMRVLVDTILNMYEGLSSRTIQLMKERNARIYADNKLKEANKVLDITLEEVNTLREIIPICSYCHSIRNDEGAWSGLEAYISSHSDVKFSHGICPKCLVKARKDAGLEDEDV